MAQDTFFFGGRRHAYVTEERTKDNERRAELSLAFHFRERHKPSLIEVGNVTRSYRSKWKHDTIDLNEKHPGMANYENADVLKWRPRKKYKAALSISTLEHTFNPPKALDAILNWIEPIMVPERNPEDMEPEIVPTLISHVLVTVPLGYYVKTDFQAAPFNTTCMVFDYTWLRCRIHILRRISRDNCWEEISQEKLSLMHPDEIRYNKKFPSANVIGVWIRGSW